MTRSLLAAIPKTAFPALLMVSTTSVFAAAPDTLSATGAWKIAGDVYGHPVDMMCQLTQTAQKLSGTCSTAADGFIAHKVDGSVKGQKFQLHFQSAFAGNSIMLIVDGTVNEDGSHVTGRLDVEPLGVGGKFEGERADAAQTPGAQTVPLSAQPTDGSSSAATDVNGTWSVVANFGPMPFRLSCELIQKQRALTGSCIGDDAIPRPLTGEVRSEGVLWRFETAYGGQAISVRMAGNVHGADGMRGNVSVEPLEIIGDFTAARQAKAQRPTTLEGPPTP